MGLVLFIVSLVLGVVLLPIGVLYGLFMSFYHRQWRTGLQLANRKLLALATAYDKYGNVACAELLNATLIKGSSMHRFGTISETISQVLGHNLQAGTLTGVGILLVDVLDFIDPGHVTKAIQPK